MCGWGGAHFSSLHMGAQSGFLKYLYSPDAWGGQLACTRLYFGSLLYPPPPCVRRGAWGGSGYCLLPLGGRRFLLEFNHCPTGSRHAWKGSKSLYPETNILRGITPFFQLCAVGGMSSCIGAPGQKGYKSWWGWRNFIGGSPLLGRVLMVAVPDWDSVSPLLCMGGGGGGFILRTVKGSSPRSLKSGGWSPNIGESESLHLGV